jgi:polymorphic toxin system DSP-PTPase phosphatase-like protein
VTKLGSTQYDDPQQPLHQANMTDFALERTSDGNLYTRKQPLGAEPMPLTELPFGLPGRVFRSPMPFGPYDLHGAVYDRFCEEQIGVIVLLASDEECLHKTGCNLRALYLKEGFQVLYLPIPDFSVPAKDDLEQAVQRTIAYAQAGHHIVVHCSAGLGRTGLFTAYLAKRYLGLTGHEALQWVRRFIPHAVETPEQQRLLPHDE